jgi:hypothetical protein
MNPCWEATPILGSEKLLSLRTVRWPFKVDGPHPGLGLEEAGNRKGLPAAWERERKEWCYHGNTECSKMDLSNLKAKTEG